MSPACASHTVGFHDPPAVLQSGLLRDRNATLQAALQYLLERVPPALSSNAHLYNSILAQSLARGRPYRAQAVLTAMQSRNVPWDPATWCSAFKLQVTPLLCTACWPCLSPWCCSKCPPACAFGLVQKLCWLVSLTMPHPGVLTPAHQRLTIPTHSSSLTTCCLLGLRFSRTASALCRPLYDHHSKRQA